MTTLERLLPCAAWLQIGAVYDALGDTHSAVEWFERLNMHLPQDPGVLARLGALHARSATNILPQQFRRILFTMSS